MLFTQLWFSTKFCTSRIPPAKIYQVAAFSSRLMNLQISCSLQLEAKVQEKNKIQRYYCTGKLYFYSTQLMSKSFSFMSHFCVSWEMKGLFVIFSWSFVSLEVTSRGPSRSGSDCCLDRLNWRDKRRETSCKPPHFSNARAIS